MRTPVSPVWTRVLRQSLGTIQICLVALMLVVLASAAAPQPAHAQTTTCYGRPITTLDFRNPVLVSGTALSVGAIYRFSNVSSGIDARVRINSINNATLGIMDRDSGLIQNFQPELVGGAPGSIDFTITFVTAGTTTPSPISFAASGIDIDGDSSNLREYSEFAGPITAYVLDSNTNLDVNASGPTNPSYTRFESRTTFTAPGIDPNAKQNIVSVLYSTTSTFNYRIGSLGSGATTRLTSLDFSCPLLPIPTQTTIVPQDFGDAPSAYGNPVHDIVSTFRLGPTNTSEIARYNSPNADGDAGDDGVTIPQLRRSTPATINLQVTGTLGRLQAWIDYNGNGSFGESGEQIALNLVDNGPGDTNPATGVIGVSVSPPATAVLTQTFARFRWSDAMNIGSTGVAPNGEVEDYAVTIWGLPNVMTSKISIVYDPAGAGLLAVPGNDVVYTITTSNSGLGPPDTNSLFVVDSLPLQLEFFNGDFNGAAAGTSAVEFVSTAPALTFNPATDLRFSNSAVRPTSFAACNYTPASGYDPAIRHICFSPKGTMAVNGASNFTYRFRARIR